jgi:hypothetical protein
VPASIATGDPSATSCQPEALSPEKMASASIVPSPVQRWPTCVPVSWTVFQNRRPVM